jgi:phosphomannomutase
MGIFKAYDIRGLYPKELDANMARRIGNAFATLLKAEELLVGRDMRTHSPELAAAVIEGMRDAGANVLDIGLASTPMAYFAIGSRDVDGGLNVTASHNPGQYNGMKLCGRGARPISAATGIRDIERMCAKSYPKPARLRGSLRREDLLGAYADHVAGFAHLERPVRLAIDAANGMAGHTLPAVLERLPLVRASTLFMEPDGTFPNHEANPLKEENLDPVRALVRETGSELGVSFDGDADRCCFVDEQGRTVGADLMTALLSRWMLARHPGRAIVYDLRSSWVVREEIERAGGVAVRDRVGHSFIKATMRARKAIFGGELSGHFYFAENFTSDSGEIAMLSALDLLSRGGQAPERARRGPAPLPRHRRDQLPRRRQGRGPGPARRGVLRRAAGRPRRHHGGVRRARRSRLVVVQRASLEHRAAAAPQSGGPAATDPRPAARPARPTPGGTRGMNTPLRRAARALLWLALLPALALPPACGGGRAPASMDREPAAGRRVVAGTVLDAATGAPVQGAEISAPGGGKGRSDASGRFTLELPVEASGTLTARAADGRTGSVLLRAAREGVRRLEVVLHVAP